MQPTHVMQKWFLPVSTAKRIRMLADRMNKSDVQIVQDAIAAYDPAMPVYEALPEQPVFHPSLKSGSFMSQIMNAPVKPLS